MTDDSFLLFPIFHLHDNYNNLHVVYQFLKLAKELNIPFYDNELITRAAKESGFAEAAFHNAESKAYHIINI